MIHKYLRENGLMFTCVKVFRENTSKTQIFLSIQKYLSSQIWFLTIKPSLLIIHSDPLRNSTKNHLLPSIIHKNAILNDLKGDSKFISH